jgi:hypothetical protein
LGVVLAVFVGSLPPGKRRAFPDQILSSFHTQVLREKMVIIKLLAYTLEMPALLKISHFQRRSNVERV